MEIHIGHLYPATMSTYGDMGNIICLRQRALWRGIDVVVHDLEIGVPIPDKLDFYFFGGGQDAAQSSLSIDLLNEKGRRILADVTGGVPLLAICGGYQLLGRSYLPFEGNGIPGLGLFPIQTKASKQRMVGNLIIEANPKLGFRPERSTVVGFENHSGKTMLLDVDATPLGTVRSGFGNNGQDRTEGCVVGSAIGCYLHGSLLPKNPHIADWLLERACQRHSPHFSLPRLDDSIEWAAHDYIVGRYARR